MIKKQEVDKHQNSIKLGVKLERLSKKKGGRRYVKEKNRLEGMGD